MKTLLICPSVRPAVPELSEHRPLVLAPILGECVVTHWIEHLALLGASHVQIVTADRAHQVRAALDDGAKWGVKLEFIEVSTEPTATEAANVYKPGTETGWLPAPYAIVVLDHLPGRPDLPLFETYASWFAAIVAWMPRALTPARVRVSEFRPGIWVGRRAHVSSKAELIAPCWIGDQVFVEPGAIIGPGAIIEDRSVVESEAHVTQSWVGPDTFVGPMTSVASSLAWRSSLTNWRSDSTLRVPDPFLLCSLAPRATRSAEPSAHPKPAPAGPTKSALSWMPAWPPPVRSTQESNPPA